MTTVQYVSLIVSVIIVLGALGGMWLAPARKRTSQAFWVIFGLVGIVFYVLLGLGTEIGHPFSAYRTLIQYTLVATWLWMWNYINWRDGKNE